MWDPDHLLADPSFGEPIADPGTEPTAGPLVCVALNYSWRAILAGCALQVCQPPSWAITDPDLLADVLRRSMDLLYLVATAGPCVQSATVDITILTGNAYAEATVTFPQAYGDTARVVVSESTGLYIASVSSSSSTGCVMRITARFNVLVDSTATVTWMAQGE